jgi:hypothetical protein
MIEKGQVIEEEMLMKVILTFNCTDEPKPLNSFPVEIQETFLIEDLLYILCPALKEYT